LAGVVGIVAVQRVVGTAVVGSGERAFVENVVGMVVAVWIAAAAIVEAGTDGIAVVGVVAVGIVAETAVVAVGMLAVVEIAAFGGIGVVEVGNGAVVEIVGVGVVELAGIVVGWVGAFVVGAVVGSETVEAVERVVEFPLVAVVAVTLLLPLLALEVMWRR
jgi:hypothetical protein